MWFVFAIALVVGLIAWYQNQRLGSDAPFVPTDTDVVERVMDMAHVTEKDVVYDLGSGDGRFVMAAGMKGAVATGIELNLLRVLYSRLWLRMLRLQNTKIVREDIFNVDLSDATVVICYLLQETNDKLQEKLEKELKPGTKVVSVAFEFKDWKVEKIDPRGVIYGALRMYIKS